MLAVCVRMHLKNLTVLGFKSFADRTSFDFEPGITAIVGPNGCGKSNVADAIRWVLGEQSAKALRGGEMADVIFNGTDKRKAIGMAEVSLTISDIDEEQIRAAGIPVDFNEVTITRRVFRDGGSEYFINKTAARLKDIQQLFMGTGVGRTSYSIMAQGNITQILSSRPEDRRLIFEEAAGITRFKAQKREALRKIEHTEQNLLRVADLVKEVKRQIGSLQRQAGKARRYQQHQEELEQLDTRLARHEYDEIQARIGEKKSRIDRIAADLEARGADLSRGEEEIRQLRRTLGDLEAQVHRMEQEGIEIRNRIGQRSQQIQHHRELLREQEIRKEGALSEIREGEERITQAREELDQLRSALEEARVQLKEKEARVGEHQDRVHRSDAAIARTREESQAAEARAFTTNQELSRKRNELDSLELFESSNRSRLEKLSTEKVQLEEERQQLGENLQAFVSNVETRRREAVRHQEAVREREQRLVTLEESLQALGAELDSKIRKHAEERSRLAVLEQLDANREGFDQATLSVLSRSDAVLGSLADFIRVPNEHLGAVEAALGHHLQVVLARSESGVGELIGEIRSLGKGRASVTSPERPVPPAPAAVPRPGSAAPLIDLLTVEGEAADLVRSLLESTLLVEDLDTARRLWKERPRQCDFVTADGEILTRQGICTVGGEESGADRSLSILGRKNEIRELRGSSAVLREAIERKEGRKGALEDRIGRIREELSRERKSLREVEMAVASDEREHAVLCNSRSLLEKKIETVVYEVRSLAEQAEENRSRRERIGTGITEVQERAREAEAEAERTGRVMETLRTEREEANAALTECRVECALALESLSSLERQKAPLEQRIGELGQLVGQRQTEIASLLEAGNRREVEIAQCRQEVEALEEKRRLNSGILADLSGRRQEQQEDIERRESGIRDLRITVERLRQEQHELEIRLAEDNLKVENLCRKMEDRYRKDLRTLPAGPIVEDEEGEETVATDREEMAKRAGELQRKLESMGPVNMVAIEEYEESEQRFEFLSSQHDELVEAKDELHEVLDRINTQTREMFHETFNRIRENFRMLFQEIFGGGHADLRLSDEADDILESGIDIVARPPGKRLQGISLLSGGEQTMTAVSLLFSIYQVRPSPFCVLDELDAPLDESNIARFIKVLRRFLDFSQFVIITHNKRTIETANILYGVTMQERGVSRLVGVRFHPEEEREEEGVVPEPA